MMQGSLQKIAGLYAAHKSKYLGGIIRIPPTIISQNPALYAFSPFDFFRQDTTSEFQVQIRSQ